MFIRKNRGSIIHVRIEIPFTEDSRFMNTCCSSNLIINDFADTKMQLIGFTPLTGYQKEYLAEVTLAIMPRKPDMDIAAGTRI